MVMLGEPMGFVPHVLQQAKGEAMSAEPKRLLVPHPIDGLFPFGQGQDDRPLNV